MFRFKAKDVMIKKVVTIHPESSLKEAVKIILKKGISGLPVIDNSNKIIGILTEKDIINYMISGNLNHALASEAMSTNIISVSSDTDLTKIALLFCEKGIKRVPVIDNGKLVGIISRRDMIRSITNEE
ncbi:MAG: hypothetical protein A2474_00035 [Elusimicrobia bacterium RIFOXYC2_FULL_34_12]|nr:MAG: hypothetical protein A2474_00035 [Elusimicrobia bacterium RIFOXYC2_FULL_34_12]OGS38206.1 MAG: hypothetical protein A2551_03190 [Elusimicrobia bacterium RIFOXYD2_FULL_34_30]HAM38119.1 hypothetical protein [Elusimicrobiota bacterium]